MKILDIDMYDKKIIENFLNSRVVSLFWILDYDFLSWNEELQKKAYEASKKIQREI